MQNLASVIIVNYNGADYLQACLESVLRQGYASFEVIVVDNSSDDDSKQVLEEYSSRVKVVYLDRNTGFGGGCLEVFLSMMPWLNIRLAPAWIG